MSKLKISITVSDDVLGRIDAVAEARGETRSYLIDRMLRSGVEAQEELLRDMENPVVRGFARLLASSPGVVKGLAKIGGRELTDEDWERLAEKIPGLVEGGRERAGRRKRGPRLEPGGAGG